MSLRSYLLVGLVACAGVYAVVTNLPSDAEAKSLETKITTTTFVKGIAFDGNRELPVSDLRAAITTRVGNAIDTTLLAADHDALEAWLASRGYLAAKVGAAAIAYANDGAYIVFDVQQGPLFHVRDVTVSGPGQIEAKIVTIATHDPATELHIAQAKQTFSQTLARMNMNSDIDVITHRDAATASLDIEFVTR